MPIKKIVSKGISTSTLKTKERVYRTDFTEMNKSLMVIARVCQGELIPEEDISDPDFLKELEQI